MPDMTLVNAPLTADRTITFPDASGTLALSGGPSLLYFTEAQSTAAPNATVYANSLTAVAAVADADAVLAPKGTGSLLAQVPDGLTTGGNKRGTSAVDFQMTRAAASQVASGVRAFIGAGNSNTASGGSSVVVGGDNNTCSASNAAVVGGASNGASGTYAFVGGGQQTTATASWAAAVGGNQCAANAAYSFIGGGFNAVTTVGAICSVIVGGTYNRISAAGLYAFVGAGGANTLATNNEANAQSAAVVAGDTNTASAQNAFIGAGTTNAASGTNSVVVGGNGNTASGIASFIGAGIANTAAAYSVVGGGESNTSSASHGSLGGGQSNTVQQTFGTVSGGQANLVANNSGAVGGGGANSVLSDYATIPGGLRAQTRYYGEVAHASGQFAAKGDAQASEVVSRGAITVAAAATDLTFDGGAPTTANTLVLANNQAYQFSVRVVAKEATAGSTQCAWWHIVGGIIRGAAAVNTALVGANVVGTGNAGGDSAGWTCVAQANTTDGSLQILVSAPAGTGTIRFVATTQLTRVAS